MYTIPLISASIKSFGKKVKKNMQVCCMRNIIPSVSLKICRHFIRELKMLEVEWSLVGTGVPAELRCEPVLRGALVSTGARGEWKCMQPRRCHLCFKVFSNSGNLRQHISNMHLPCQAVPCQVCHRVFKNKEYLRKHHVQTHNAPLRRPRPNSAGLFGYDC